MDKPIYKRKCKQSLKGCEGFFIVVSGQTRNCDACTETIRLQSIKYMNEKTTVRRKNERKHKRTNANK